MSRFVISYLKTKFGDFTVVVQVVTVLLLCCNASLVSGHPTNDTSMARKLNGTSATGILWISQELQTMKENDGEDDADSEEDDVATIKKNATIIRPAQNENSLLTQFFNVLIKLQNSRLQGDQLDEQMQSDQPMNRTQIQQQYENYFANRVLQFAIRSSPTGNVTFKNNGSINETDQIAEARRKIPKAEKDSDNFVRSTSLYPSCALPSKIDKDEWQNSNSINLYFRMNFSKPQGDQIVQINEAVLHLYKLPVKLMENVNSNSDLPAPELQDAIQKSHVSIPKDVVSHLKAESIAENKQIKVQIYYYRRPLKNPKSTKPVKKKLLATRMLYASKTEDTTWNIKKAARIWENNSNKNFGITITVEDENGQQLPAHLFFHVFNCSNPPELSIPYPAIIRNALKKQNEKQFPLLDLVEEFISSEEYLLNSAKQFLDEKLNSEIPEDGSIHHSNSQNPRMRHGHQKKNNKERSNQSINQSKEYSDEVQ